MRIAPVHGTQQMRLSLYLPRRRVDAALARIDAHASSADIQQIVELPHEPTDAWRDFVRARANELCIRDRRRPTVSTDTDDSAVQMLLTRERIVLALDVADRDALFRWAGARLAPDTGPDARDIAHALHEREQSGSTALGNGFAIPHARLPGLRRPAAVYVRFAEPLDFDAPDAKPVADAVIVLAPAAAISLHLSLLADVAQRFCDARFRDALRGCTCADAVLACLDAKD